MRRLLAGLWSVVLIGLLTTCSEAAEKVRVGLTKSVFPGMTDKKLEEAAKPFRSLFESSTGMTGLVVLGGDAKSLAVKLKDDKVQLGVFQGIEFAWARKANPKLQPIVICVNQQRTLKAYLLVRAAAPFKKPAELRGKTLAIPAETREHCLAMLRVKCLPSGSTPQKFYKKVVRSTDVEEALDDVVDGKLDAALVDGLAWSSYRDAKPGAAKRLRVLLASEPFPATVIACQPGRFNPGQLKRIRAGLIGAKYSRRDKQLLEQLRLSGFQAVPADYERLVKAAATAYPPPK